MSQLSYPVLMSIGFAGLIADAGSHMIESSVNAEASASLPFGDPVRQGVLDGESLAVTADTQVIKGLIAHSHAYAKGDHLPGLDGVGLTPKTTLNVMRWGRIFVVAGATVAAGTRLFYNTVTRRWVVAGGATIIDATGQVVARTSGVNGGLIVVECDFRNEP